MRSPRVTPTRITTTNRVPSVTMPVISVTYTGWGTGVVVGIMAGIGVGTNVVVPVADGRGVAVGAVRVGASVGELTADWVVGVGEGGRAAAAICPFWRPPSVSSAAWADANERNDPARVVMATRTNNTIMSALGRRGWFIVLPSIS